MKNTSDSDAAGRAPGEALSVAEIAAKILPPLTPLRDENGFICDTGALAARCQLGHIHKYFIRDIMVESPRCTTCKQGNLFSIMARETIEKLLEMPFIVVEHASTKAFEYTNPILKLTLVCLRYAGHDIASTAQDGHYTLTIGHTKSQKKVLKFLVTHLSEYKLLNDKQRSNIRQQTRRKTIKYKKSPLPVTQELALMIGGETSRAGLAPDEVNFLRLENC